MRVYVYTDTARRVYILWPNISGWDFKKGEGASIKQHLHPPTYTEVYTSDTYIAIQTQKCTYIYWCIHIRTTRAKKASGSTTALLYTSTESASRVKKPMFVCSSDWPIDFARLLHRRNAQCYIDLNGHVRTSDVCYCLLYTRLYDKYVMRIL